MVWIAIFQELHGLKAIIKYVYTLPANKKNVPELITDPILLIKDVRTLIEMHCHDSPDLSVTGRPVLPPQVSLLMFQILRACDLRWYITVIDRTSFPLQEKPRRSHKHEEEEGKVKIVKHNTAKVNMNGPRRRRTRCKNCQACRQADCGECAFCHDMVKFGGPGRAKQTCVMRQCLQVSAVAVSRRAYFDNIR